MSLSTGDFDEYFQTIHDGRVPFRWQRRLLMCLLENGRWPDRIVAPTGAGKRSAIEIHVFAVALMAVDVAPRLPRRLAMVVDRRALVDDQYDHASELAELLRHPPNATMAKVADALRRLPTDEDQPLRVARLRGGMPAPRDWYDEPTGCVVLCATPDMWGSRLLLRGYGTSPWARPREAGLLATDAAVVVDEAHLCRQLLTTARRVSRLREVAEELLPVPGLQVVETTATPDAAATGVAIGVELDDLSHDEVLRRRMKQPKTVELLELPAWPLPSSKAQRKAGLGTLAHRAVALRDQYGPTVGCFVNTVDMAVSLAAELDRSGYSVEVLCGRLRTFDIEHIRLRRPGLLTIEGNADVDFVVSTQTLEVGSDLDWSALLTELAPATALAQRAGRVNRRGDRDATTVVVAVPAAELREDPREAMGPYQIGDLNEALRWLSGRHADRLGLAPWALIDDPPPTQSPRRTLYQRPELADAWLWARTSDHLFAEPDLDLWLSDDLEHDLDVGLVVRHDLPRDPTDAVALVRAVLPRAYETFPIRIGEARKLLTRHFSAGQDQTPFPWPVRVRGDDVAPYTTNALRPGDVVIIDDRVPAFQVVGQSGTGVVAAAGGAQVEDVLERRTAMRGEVVLRVGSGSLFDQDVAGPMLKEVVEALDDRAPSVARRRVADILDALVGQPHAPLTQLTDAQNLLRGNAKDSDLIVHVDADGEPIRFIVVDSRRAVRDEGTRQQWTPQSDPVLLEKHAQAVAGRAGMLAARLRLGDRLASLLERAGLHHDDGKRDDRFQIVLGRERGAGDQALAKSGMTSAREAREARTRSGLPA